MTGLEPFLLVMGKKFFDWANSPSKDSSPAFNVQGDTVTYASGVLLKLRCTPTMPEGAFVGLNILSQSGSLMKGEEGFRDEDGDFCLTARPVNNVCKFYLPFAAIRYPSAGGYQVHLTAMRMRGPNDPAIFIGRCHIDLELPKPRPWRKIEYIGPVLDLCMLIVRAGGRATARKVRFVKNQLREQFELRDSEVDQMREAMKVESPYPVDALAELLLARFVNLDIDAFLSLLTGIAKSDGIVTAAEVEIVRSIALACGCTPGEWAQRAKSLGLQVDDHWSVLGLTPGASLQQITAAFRRLIQKHHPDRFSTASEEVRHHASQKTVAITEAYKALRAQVSASA
jgi:DnaJ like chaperone protein